MLKYQQVLRLQRLNGYDEMQTNIFTGLVWKLEGSAGRLAMNFLKEGICMLPKEVFYDYYGNRIPSRDELKQGTKGTFHNCANYWEKYKYQLKQK
jgi:hypothetical protein